MWLSPGTCSLDTGRLNAETYRLFDKVEKHYGIRIEYTFPDAQVGVLTLPHLTVPSSVNKVERGWFYGVFESSTPSLMPSEMDVGGPGRGERTPCFVCKCLLQLDFFLTCRR